jgi:hypothetical protein
MRFIFQMTPTTPHTSSKKWLTVLFSALLLVTFFLPWVSWDGARISGYSMPAGDFFKTSESKFGLANPFPQLSFTLAAFWLIPALAILTGAAVLLKKKSVPLAFLAGSFSLALLTVYIAFTSGQIDPAIFKLLKPAAYLQALAAIGLILSAFPVKSVIPKIAWLVVGPVIAFIAYKAGEKYIYGETHAATENVTADYSLTADALIREFTANDTATTRKYREKVLVVTGKVSAAEIREDSTSTVKFADSTGSYAIFPLEKDQFEEARKIQAGDEVSLKGVCSGGSFSRILGVTKIDFKRATFNKK